MSTSVAQAFVKQFERLFSALTFQWLNDRFEQGSDKALHGVGGELPLLGFAGVALHLR